MSKVLPATCEGGVVKIQGQTVSANIISGGVGESQGLVLIDKGEVYYFASSYLDLVDLIDKLKDTVDQIVLISTGLDAAALSPGTQAANIAQLTVIATELNLLKDVLR